MGVRPRVAAPLLALLLAAAATSTSVPPARAASSGLAPSFLRTLGGPLHARVYPSGLEVAPDGNLVVADTGNDAIRTYSPDGAELWAVGSQGSGAGEFSEPRDVGVDDAGRIYVADAMNRRIVVLEADGTWVTTFSGPPGDEMGTPMGASVSDDRLYVADAGQNVIRVFDLAGNQTERIAAIGPCVLTGVRDADADAAGNIYGASYTAGKIVKFDPSGGRCLNTWGTKGTGNGQFKSPYGVRIAFDPVAQKQRVYVADSNNERVQVFSLTGVFVETVGIPGEPEQPGTLAELRRVAVAADGDIWAADLWGWRLQRYDRTATGWTGVSQVIGTPLPPPTSTAVFHEVRGLAINGDVIAATDTVHHRAVRMSTTSGDLLGTPCGERGSVLGQFNWPRSVAWDEASGQLWVADTKQYRIQVIDPVTCDFVAKIGTKGTGVDQFNWVYSVAIRQTDGIAVIADGKNNRIKVYDVRTRLPLAVYGTRGGGVGRFREPQGVAIDPSTGHVYVADTGNDRVVELSVSPSGAVTWVRAITGGFLGPQGVAADANDRIYVADTMNDRMAVVSKQTGRVTGTFDGPGGFDAPGAVAVDSTGNVYVADTYNDRIVKFSWETANESSLSIGDTHVVEGDGVTANASFEVTLSGPSASPVTATWSTGDGTAAAPGDYAAASGAVRFEAGETSAAVQVRVLDDREAEADETYSVRLSAPTGATLADDLGIGTIDDDDAAPGTSVTLSLDTRLSRTTLRARGTVRPAIPDSEVELSLVRIVDGRRALVERRSVPVTTVDGESFSTFRGGFERPTRGIYRLRVAYRGDETHLPSGIRTRFRVG